jgi:hypothetical protein
MASRSFFSAHPIVLEVNARILVRECSEQIGKRVHLGTIPDAVIDQWASLNIEGVWLMGVWATGPISKSIAIEHGGLQSEYRRALPDVTSSDIGGSPYSVCDYVVMPELGGFKSLAHLRKRLAKRHIGIILDFVCNHTARDHEWTTTHPEYYVQGTPEQERERPDMFFDVETGKGAKAIAFGKDPYFPGWTDTAQLNYESPEVRSAMIEVLKDIARVCDGVRVDMAMLILKEIFRTTWSSVLGHGKEAPTGEFWNEAIAAVKEESSEFLFMAEAYWDKEWELQQLGFDYTYDKTLYDRLLREGATSVREHLKGEMAYESRCVRFIENHDEPPAALMLPSELWHCAAATVAATIPGMFLIHEGQVVGRTVKTPVQLLRRSYQEPNQTLWAFYRSLGSILASPVFRKGEWTLLEPRQAWHDNRSSDNFLAFFWHLEGEGDRLIVVNYAPHPGQCLITLPIVSSEAQLLEFRDLLNPVTYVRDKVSLLTRGMFFDQQGYEIHIFCVNPLKR